MTTSKTDLINSLRDKLTYCTYDQINYYNPSKTIPLELNGTAVVQQGVSLGCAVEWLPTEKR